MSNPVDWTPREDAHPALDEALVRLVDGIEEVCPPLPSTGIDTECWNWTGQRNEQGYGLVKISRYRQSPMYVHIVMFLLFVGDREPRKEEIHHRCENRLCCRPSHLEKVPRGQHRAAHNRARKGKPKAASWPQIRQEIRDGKVYKVTAPKSEVPQPRRTGVGRHRGSS